MISDGFVLLTVNEIHCPENVYQFGADAIFVRSLSITKISGFRFVSRWFVSGPWPAIAAWILDSAYSALHHPAVHAGRISGLPKTAFDYLPGQDNVFPSEYIIASFSPPSSYRDPAP